MITTLKFLFSTLLVWMIYVVVSTCLESNLFTEWSFLGSIPWMRATLWDFYANVLVIYLWMWYKESNLKVKLIWFVLMISLGSIASCAYVLIQLFKLKEGEGLKELVSVRND